MLRDAAACLLRASLTTVAQMHFCSNVIGKKIAEVSRRFAWRSRRIDARVFAGGVRRAASTQCARRAEID
jgi:hypothetical protein